jgi:hypothetical protein
MTQSGEIQPSPPPLTESYHKARKNLALFSGLLIAWELVGLKLGTRIHPELEHE